MADTNTARLSASGVSIWLDDLSRDRLDSGSLAKLIADAHVVGVTTNPTIFANAIGSGIGYEASIAACAARGKSATETIFELTCADVADACDVLADVHQASQGRDGWVSIEVDPTHAHDTAATVAAARALHARIDRPNVMIKVPATPAGVQATTELIRAGISVNVTLIFALSRYREVLNAYTVGIEQARADGRDLTQIHSVASVFVSRFDSAVAAHLDAAPDSDAVGLASTIGVANARLVHEISQQQSTSERWQMLSAAGANAQRPLWASTGVKVAGLAPTHYVSELAFPGTVNTMPAATLDAVRSEFTLLNADELTRYRDADASLNALNEHGIDYGDLTRELEQQGLQQFLASWSALEATVAEALGTHQ